MLLAGPVEHSAISVTFRPESHSQEGVELRFKQVSGATTVTLQSCKQRLCLLQNLYSLEAQFLSGVAFFLFLGFF